MWAVPPIWRGRTVAILAGGAGSTLEAADLIRQKGATALVVNNAFRLAPWASMLYAADKDWWNHPANVDAKRFEGLKVSVSKVDGVLQLHNTGVAKFDPDPACVRTGMNSGYQAIHVAIHAGARKVLLCGYNLTGPNWHGPHAVGLRNSTEEFYARCRALYGGLVKPAAERDVDVVNCTPDSALNWFKHGKLEDEL